jgi:hypothetical protein
MFCSTVPTYTIDLEAAPENRWAEVISTERTTASELLEEASAEFSRVPELVRRLFAGLYKAFGGLYQHEIKSWAEGLGASVGTLTILNCAYELSHLRWPKVFGCTAGVRWIDNFGMIHVRNLDWPLPTMGAATRLFRFRRRSREFVSIGVPGQVGVLSGMLPHAYSATINWAPPAEFPSFEFGPAFLLRDVLETCDDFQSAVDRLTDTRLSTSVFITVCGMEKGQACIIERSPRESAFHWLKGPALAQANHHTASRFIKYNEDLRDVKEGEEEFSIEGSSARAKTMTEALAEIDSVCTLDDAAKVLERPTVLNKMTCQQMIFCPRTGDVRVWRRDAQEH